jgi:hypothetical protein
MQEIGVHVVASASTVNLMIASPFGLA